MRYTTVFVWMGLCVSPLLATDYYVGPNATSGGLGTLMSPYSLAGVCNDAFTPGDRLLMLPGTYYVRQACTGSNFSLMNAPLFCPEVLLGAPGSCATIDGNLTMVLAADVTSSATAFSLTLGTSISAPSSFTAYVGNSDEEISCGTRTGPGPYGYTCTRGWTATTPVSHTAGDVAHLDGFILSLQGHDVTVQNLRITNSYVGRGSTSVDFNRLKQILGTAIDVRGPRHNIFRNVIDGVDVALGGYGGADDSTFAENVVFNVGHIASDRGHGKCLYQENTGGFRHVFDNICVNTFDVGTQLYGVTGGLTGTVFNGNIIANSGAPAVAAGAYLAQWDLLVGTDHVAIPAVTLGYNRTYGGTGVHVGFNGVANTAVTWTNNYTPNGLTFDNWSSVTGNGNIVSGTLWPILTMINGPAAGTYTWNSNSHFDQTAIQNCTGGNKRGAFHFNSSTGTCGAGLDFAEWQAASLYDAASTYAATKPVDAVLTRSSALTPGRCTSAMYNWSHAPTVQLDLSPCGLSSGQGYKIVNAFNPLGAAVATGTYNAGVPNVTITMGDAAVISVAAPPGATPALTTAPEFLALVVVPISQASVRYSGRTVTSGRRIK